MSDIMALLGASTRGEPDGLFPAESAHARGLTAQARDWCRTTPDHDALEWLAVTMGARRRLRKAVISTLCDPGR